MTGIVEGVRVERAGPLALLQDAGRFGVRRLGVTQGGPVDIHSWAWANRLLGNRWGAAALEISLGGLELVACKTLRLALCGADLDARLDGNDLPRWRAFTVEPHQRLTFGTPRDGVRAYLAVAGGFRADPVLGSVACVPREGLGGHDGLGHPLKAQERLFVDSRSQDEADTRNTPQAIPPSEMPHYGEPAQLALIPGAQIADFSGASLFDAFNRSWQVDDRADRMGVRLLGPRLACRISALVSEGIGLGGVQVPPDGQPFVLLNDRQTIGGYPRLGALTPLACARLAQCMPGQEVRLIPKPLAAAQDEYRRFRAGFA
ncbi:biotin-dependent carboxyltransferase family protein [Litchfieldella xinjiangensis]|uniref:5-oxoprolinase subunit C family protein n=1 Tax=Litchfieldella xinjiangensis TaxID=1166948 RepID=UPI0005BE515D|nr:biotin-dependent carboxyltransferase family protein [Halomonas xinjiangensis]